MARRDDPPGNRLPVRAVLVRAAAVAWVAFLCATPVTAAADGEPAAAAPPGATSAAAFALPPAFVAELARARIPASALALVVQEVGAATPLLSAHAGRTVNPASVFKLATAYAALESLGPAYTWRTPVWIRGTVSGGVLTGTVAIKGSGDPAFSADRVRGLLRRVRQFGIREIRGDIVLDRSLFAPPAAAPADFDDEPLRPHNVQPDALLMAFRSLVFTFTPDPARGVVHVATDPELDGVRADTEVALLAGACDDWRVQLRADFSQPTRLRFDGGLAAACGERVWPVAYAAPAQFDARLLRAAWRDLGGTLSGRVRDGRAPVDTAPSFELVSPPLADIVRDLSKFSNNVMAQQLFLTLGLRGPAPGTPASARAVLQSWLTDKLSGHLTPDSGGNDDLAAGLVVDNGSGLSRETRISAAAIAALLQQAWRSPLMPELVSALPISGLDGTLRASRGAPGRAHLKTGSLRDVAAVAGYVWTRSGRQRVLVAVVEHPNAAAARPALDALINWCADDEPPAAPASAPIQR
jgi:D-alanyl-D-alanine carboxypeptidase/D-alanyl-D-alanine-endopeptidase (penicillin-binding protein 4)